MLKTKCIPFYLDNNSSNLPFYMLKDARGNDVIYISDNNMIYTNTNHMQLNEQISLYNKCLNQGICYNYKINKNINLLKIQKDKNIYYFLLDKENQIGIYQTYFDNLEENKVHFNDDYICITSTEYGECIPTVVAGYDIKNRKILDCEDFNTANKLYKAIVEVRRCKFDCICSILRGEVLLEDEDRLYKILSFILNKKVDKNNVKQSLKEAKPFVLKKYPKLSKLKISNNKEEIEEKNKLFGINYFYFNRMDKKLDNLKYQENKQLCKRRA